MTVVRPHTVAWLLAGLLLGANGLVLLVQMAPFWPLQIAAFLAVVLVPGMALLRATGAWPRTLLEAAIYCFGLGILLLMLGGLLANQVLHAIILSRPLELIGILPMWNLLTVGCIIFGARRVKQPVRVPLERWRRQRFGGWSLAMVAAAAMTPMLAAGGAFRLNNGGDALVALLALGWAAAVVVALLLVRHKVSELVLAWGIFSVGLAILEMTALRSWDITGHDLAREFRVYTLTHLQGHWNIAAYRDPYNACLSITILPEVLSKLLNVSGMMVFKVVLQVIFAVCPVVLFVALRRYASRMAALLGCGLFISYPTFINDSAMLTRQGVAYLFFALALLAALRPAPDKIQKGLFVLCAIGVVVSHYSTSYMFVALFAIALVGKFVLQRIRGWQQSLHEDRVSVLTLPVALILFFAVFLWYSQFTATSKGLSSTLSSSVSNIPHLFSDDFKSNDTAASLFMASQKSPAAIYQSYLASQTAGTRVADRPEYHPAITGDDLPVTALGARLAALGISPKVTAAARQGFAKVLQLAAIISVVCVVYWSVFRSGYLFSHTPRGALPLDLICLSMAGITVLALMSALPNLSINYGVLRTMQQSLIFLVIPLMFCLGILGRYLRPWLRTTLATGSLAALFLLFTGVCAQLLGGVSATLTLNNHGLYYGLYYTTAADRRSAAWLYEHIPASAEVQAASHAKALMHNPDYPFKAIGVLPTQKHAGSFVYLDAAQMQARKLYVNYEGNTLITRFPLAYYQDQTNHLYSTGSTGVFR